MSCVWTVVQKKNILNCFFFPWWENLAFYLLYFAIMLMHRYTGIWKVLKCSVHVKYLSTVKRGCLEELGLIQAPFHLVLFLHWLGLLLHFTYFDKVTLLIFGATNETYVNSTCRYFLLLCILSNCRKQKYTLELQSSVKRILNKFHDSHTCSMLVVCHLCIIEYCIKGALISSNRVCIIYYTCTEKNPFHKGIAHSCRILQ